MTPSRTLALTTAALCAATLGWGGLSDALAQDPDPAPTPTPRLEVRAASTPQSLKCQVFLVDVGSGFSLETADRTTEIGQWVGEQVDDGWRLHGVDFEVGQKSTGYPQGYVQVCVQPE